MKSSDKTRVIRPIKDEDVTRIVGGKLAHPAITTIQTIVELAPHDDRRRTTAWHVSPDVELLDRTRVYDAPRPASIARGSSPPPMQALALSPSPLSPEIQREVFGLARHVALQSDLMAAVRVLRHGLTKLLGARDATCVFFDPALGAAWAPSDHDAAVALPDQAQELVARVATSGQRVVVASALVEPIGPAPARAVLVLRRQTPFTAVECAIAETIAHAVAGLLAHFQADHAARQAQAERDAKTPFRPEALANRRRAGALPGRFVAVPRRWIRWAFPVLITLVAIAIAGAAFVQVPTYSTGVGIVTVEGEQVTAPMPGTVAEVLVAPNTRVAAGEPLVRMRAIEEEAEAAAAESDYRNALALVLANPGDDGSRMTLAALTTRRQRARAAIDARTLRATTDGVVGDIRVRPGVLLAPGAQVMKVARPDAMPTLIAVLPGFDRPRLSTGMIIQLQLPGYHGRRAEAVIESVGSQVVGPDEARRSLGDPIGDALPISGPVVIVRARLSARTFEADGREFELHDGMLGKAEVRVARRSLLGALLGRGEGG